MSTTDPKPDGVRPDWDFGKESASLGSGFIEKTGQITPVPQLEFQTGSRVFVIVPLCREQANAERLIASWRAQVLPAGMTAEVIFLVNNTGTADPAVVEENSATYDLLRQATTTQTGQVSENPSLRFHVVDKFSPGNALPDNTPIGSIRNIAIAPVVKHAVDQSKNCLVLSTDGDCFPSPNVMQRLHDLFLMRKQAAGSIARTLEFSDEFTPEEKVQLKQLILLGNIEQILLNYLSYGVISETDLMAGSNTFFSLDVFLETGGYSDQPDVAEDTDMSHKLQVRLPGNITTIDDATITNIFRLSDRLNGDGSFISRLRRTDRRGFYSPSNARSTIFQVQLRRWLLETISTRHETESGQWAIDRLVSIVGDLPDDDRTRVQALVPKNSSSGFNEDDYYLFYESVLETMENHGRFPLDQAISSYGQLIDRVFSSSNEYAVIRSRLEAADEPKEFVPLYALSEFAGQSKSS